MAVFIFLRTSSRNQTIVLESLDSYFFLYARQLQFSFDLNYFCLTDKKGKEKEKLDNPSTKNLFGTSQLLIYIKQANCRRDRCQLFSLFRANTKNRSSTIFKLVKMCIFILHPLLQCKPLGRHRSSALVQESISINCPILPSQSALRT